MDSISFKHFRKFSDTTTFNLGAINIVVGNNNSGKSTLTKGLRLCFDNLELLCVGESWQIGPRTIFSRNFFFRFVRDVLDNVHIGTFGRALSKDVKDESIIFSMSVNDIDVEVCVSRFSNNIVNHNTGENIDFEDASIAPISKIVLKEHALDIRIVFDFEESSISVFYNVEGTKDLSKFEDELASLRKERKRMNDEKINYYDDVENINNRMKCLREILKYKNIQENLQFKINPNGFQNPEIKFSPNILGRFVMETSIVPLMKNYEEDDNCILFSSYKEYNTKFINSLSKNKDRGILCDVLQEFAHELSSLEYEDIINIESHSVTKSLTYNISDKNDYMAQTILEYMNGQIKEGDPEKDFVIKWMMEFGIGEDFIIESFGGECYKFEIIEDVDNPEVRTSLLDKGVGSNQIMIILLKLATIMRQNRGVTYPPLVIIEEPEQNLHPKLQSLLADMLLEVYEYPMRQNKDSRGIRFLVETHSEYLVRKTQVLVANRNKKQLNNPFVVYYLSDIDEPQKMIYSESGVFENSFGEGFYDESLTLSDQIL